MPSDMLNQNPAIDKALKEAARKKKSQPPSILGGIIAATFSKETGMSKYSKLIAAVVGSVVGMVVSVIFGWAISHGLGTCSVIDPQIGEVCKIAGMTQAEITTWLMGILMTYFAGQLTYSFPPNTKVVSTAPTKK